MIDDVALEQRLGEAGRMPYGRGQIAAVEAIVRRADAEANAPIQYAARILATNAYVMGGEPGKAFVPFAWCLAVHDRGEADPHYDHELMWSFKWIVNALAKFPEVPLDKAMAVLDDMERRYRLAGYSMNAVHQYRVVVAQHVGDEDTAAEHYRLWCAAPRDGMSDCVGCEPTSKVSYLAWRRRDEDAVALAVPVLAGEMTCVEQPQSILTDLLLPYVRTGRLTEAAEAHRSAYRRLRTERRELGPIASHVEFCARTGNTARAIELVQRHLTALEEPPSPLVEMEFAASGALALRLAAEAEPGIMIRRDGADVDATEVAAELSLRAKEIAARFDERNGTSRQGDRSHRSSPRSRWSTICRCRPRLADPRPWTSRTSRPNRRCPRCRPRRRNWPTLPTSRRACSTSPRRKRPGGGSTNSARTPSPSCWAGGSTRPARTRWPRAVRRRPSGSGGARSSCSPRPATRCASRWCGSGSARCGASPIASTTGWPT
ncbi:hypothetical protein [Herbihabitans rhizosphaerae]|uniref:hypothetical protein n=1 Tax=Herbihabitans rhizosphaerae TaxID=1872711 RepID=UPI0030FE7AB4